MTEKEINFNYKKAMTQVNDLRTIASSLSKVSDASLKNCMTSVSKNWKGTNAEEYVKKGGRLEAKISATAKNIKLTAETIETMAKNVYNAEMAALRAATVRTY